MRYGYARVSTDEQNLDLQIDALTRAGCDRILQDVITGRSKRRPGLDQLIDLLRPGDAVVVWRVDRLGRNFYHLVTVAQEFSLGGVSLVSLTEGLDTSTPLGQAIYRMICIFAELERESIVERTRAGIAAARRRGQLLGRRPKMSEADIKSANTLIDAGMSAEEVARRYGVCRSTIYRHRRGEGPGGFGREVVSQDEARQSD